MREHYFKKVNVLGIDVTVMRPEKAVNSKKMQPGG